MLKVGQAAPDFSASDEAGRTVRLADFKGKKVVLYFYPKDDTPGCTKEARSFRDGAAELRKLGAVVLGVSIDSVTSHQRFKAKYRLNFPLLSDADKRIVSAYGVWKQKSLYGRPPTAAGTPLGPDGRRYGRTFLGIERTTVLIDEQGRIAKIFPKVKVAVHLEEVLAALGPREGREEKGKQGREGNKKGGETCCTVPQGCCC